MGLKEYRIKNNKTQFEVAINTKIQLRTLQRIEKANNCDLIKAKLIAEYFKDTIDNIFFK